MLYEEERKIKIVQYVQEHSRASVQELSEQFQVSESTIRRDLKELEKDRLLKRTHGGAVCLQGVNFEPTFEEKEDQFRQEKEHIAKKAVEFITEGDTILLDSGTTTLHLAKEIKAFKKLTVVTNSLTVAYELQGVSGIEVLLVGGTLRKNTLALVGPVAEQTLDMFRVDKAFIATNGLDIKEGLTTPNPTEAATKRKMIQVAKQVILLADHTKVGKVAFAKVAELTQVNKCIMDSGVSSKLVKDMRKLGIEVYVVEM